MALVGLIKALALGIFFVYLGGYICNFSCSFGNAKIRDWRDSPQFFGPLTRNNVLDKAKRLFENQIGFGPESLAIKNGVLYTGVTDGSIVKIVNNKPQKLVKIGGKDCVSWMNPKDGAELCGYPLGMRFDSAGDLVVADFLKGVYKINVNTGSVTTLVKPDTLVNGVKFRFANDLDIAKNGDIYFTEFDTELNPLRPFWMNILSPKPTGRILRYNAKTKKVELVVDHIYGANGVQLSPEEDFVIVSQVVLHNIMKYNLKGPKQGQLEIFSDNLPGLPDNIRPSGRGTYWIALYSPRIPNDPTLWDKIGCKTSQFLLFGGLEVIGFSFYYLNNLMPMDFLKTSHLFIRDIIDSNVFKTDYGLVLELNLNGEILRSLHSPQGTVNKISQVTEHEGTLYFSSPFNSFIGKINLQ